jgi:hypothetical protein
VSLYSTCTASYCARSGDRIRGTATVEVCGKADAESSLAHVAVSDLIAMVWPRIVLVVAVLRGLRSKAFFAQQQSPRAR